MINEVYSLLNNSLARDLVGIVAADYVPSEYRPVRSSEIIHQLWRDLVGESLQARQYWICHIRRLLERGFSPSISTRFDARQAYSLSDLQRSLAEQFSPQTNMPSGWRVSNPNWWSNEYSINRLSIQINNNTAELFVNDSSRPQQTVSLNLADNFVFTIASPDELSLIIEKEQVGDGGFLITWATRPRESLHERAARLIELHRPAIHELIDGDANRLESQYRASLGSLVNSPAAGAMRAGGLAMLIAGHFAKLMDSR